MTRLGPPSGRPGVGNSVDHAHSPTPTAAQDRAPTEPDAPRAPVPRRPPRRRLLNARMIGLTCLTVLAAAWVWLSTAGGPSTGPPPERSKAGEGVVNGSAATDVSGWQVASETGNVTLGRATITDGPEGATTAVDIRGTGDSGEWAFALGELSSPATFFEVGRTYRLQAYVRDVDASGQSVGLLLANGNYRNQPTTESAFEGYKDDDWHRLTVTFVCTNPASPDTALYLSLPTEGDMHWQVTGASVQATDLVRPPDGVEAPTRVVDFAGPAGDPPDPAVWNHEVGGHGWGNGEVQTYTESTDNARLDGQGNLVITARREEATGPDDIERDYTSARLTTKGKLEVQPGSYVEAPIRPPVGEGVWPAFWLIGTNVDKVGWPASGELDVLEIMGGKETVAHSWIHMASQSDPDREVDYGGDAAGGSIDLGHPLDSRTHRYGVYFDDTMVRFYIDREEYLSLDADDALAAGATWPFGEPQFLVLNVAIGGVGGDPSSTPFPKEMVVGPVSIWEGRTPF